jgi:hypothetical protein
MLHSSTYDNALDYKGKKVVVLGTCVWGMFNINVLYHTTLFVSCFLAHEIAVDCYENDVGVCFYNLYSSFWMAYRRVITM